MNTMQRPRRRAGGAPHGIRHGKAQHPFAVVEWLRDLHEHDGIKFRTLHKLFPCIPRDTLRDWLYYRTRTIA